MGTRVKVPPVCLKFNVVVPPPVKTSEMRIISPLPTFTTSPFPSLVIPLPPPDPLPAQARKSPPLVVTLPNKSKALALYPPEPIEGPFPTVNPFQV